MKNHDQSSYNRRLNFPAFPFAGFLGGSGMAPQPSNTGMSFRDYVAVKAMQQMLLHDMDIPSKELAYRSFDIANAMLMERERH